MEDFSDKNALSGSGGSQSQFLLDYADDARKDGNTRLAIHLYCAAFELAVNDGQSPDERTLYGLRQAWLMACEQGDRSTAEAIFNDLAPYNSAEQTQEALAQLQGLAIEQLEDLGLQKSDIEDMALALADELEDAGVDIEALTESLVNAVPIQLPKINLNAITSQMALRTFPGNLDGTPAINDDTPEQDMMPKEHEICYRNLYGFETAKAKMREFGIVDPNDLDMLGFLEQAESFHGISGPVLSKAFLFSGPSREDLGIFATATATEIGWPIINMIIDLNEAGDGTIKVMAPMRRSMFGPPRIPDLPNPCTLVIQNIDILQDLFWKEEQAISRGHGPFGFRASDGSSHGAAARSGANGSAHGGHCHSLKCEILNYLASLEARGGIFLIATTGASPDEEPLILGEELESLIGPMQEISIDYPTRTERRRVLERFSEDHPSFHDLDLFKLSQYSKEMGRYDIVLSCRKAIEQAYSRSLKTQRHQMVGFDEVLQQFTEFIDHQSTAYQQIEDYVVEQFASSLDWDFSTTVDYPEPMDFGLDDRSQPDNPDSNSNSNVDQ